jgi:alpha-tubulin suppressor-like RCC1 family protein
MFVGRSSGRRLAWAALLGALPVGLGACGLLIGLEDHTAFPGADAGEDVIEPPDAPPVDAPADAVDDALPDVVGPDGCSGTVCGAECVDTSSDAQNCGKCGVACLGGFSCAAGVCGDHIEQISAGSNHGCALLHNGSIWCWGNDESGQLGILAGEDTKCVTGYLCHPTPIQVEGLPVKMRQVSAGADSTCALDENGDVWCWGLNDAFQLGRATLPSSPDSGHDRTPVKLVSSLPNPPLPKFAQVSVGSKFACARAADGSVVYCWGSNLAGTLGNGAKGGNLGGFPPIALTSLPAGLIDLSTGLGDHVCVLDGAHHAWCWGSNTAGQLGHSFANDTDLCPMTKCNSTPSIVPGLTVNGGWIRSGGTDTCAEVEVGKVACWGSNVYGQLGVAPDAMEHPMALTLLTADAQIAATFRGSHNASCVIDNKQIECWGDDTYGELGRGKITSGSCVGGGFCDPVLALVKPTGGFAAVQLATGAFWSMALTSNNTIYAWGANLDGRIGHDPLSSNDLGTCGYQAKEACNPTPTLVPQPGAAP